MGYNTTVLILNDALSWIEDDPGFAKRLCASIKQFNGSSRAPASVTVSARSKAGGVHCTAATVIETHHAGIKAVISVGENCGIVLGSVMGPRNDGTQDSRLAILKDLLEKCGYYIAKIPKPTKPSPCNCGHAFKTHRGLRHPGETPVPGHGACVAKGCECWDFDDENK